MSTHGSRVDLEEIEVTRTEKLLAVVLTVFFLIGGVWAYTKLDDIGRSEYRPAQAYFTSAERAAVARAGQAQRQLERAAATEQQARQDLELAREAYRTALDAGTKAPGLQASYRAAQRDFAAAQAEVARTRGEVAESQPAADAAYNRADEEARQDSRQSEIVTFLLRLALLLGTLGFAYWLLIRMRRSGSRYLPVAFALVAFGALLALVMAGDYVAHHIDVAQARAACSLARRHRVHARCLLVATGLSRAAHPAAACAQGRVPVLRLSGARRGALRGMRTRGDRRVHDLPRAAAGRCFSLRSVWSVVRERRSVPLRRPVCPCPEALER